MPNLNRHTPGPWQAERIGGTPYDGKEKAMSFRIVADTSDPKEREIAILYYKPYFEAAKSNARLIAAAPDLLEAAELYVLAECGRPVYFEKLRAAIRRARGGE